MTCLGKSVKLPLLVLRKASTPCAVPQRLHPSNALHPSWAVRGLVEHWPGWLTSFISLDQYSYRMCVGRHKRSWVLGVSPISYREVPLLSLPVNISLSISQSSSLLPSLRQATIFNTLQTNQFFYSHQLPTQQSPGHLSGTQDEVIYVSRSL